MKITVSVTLLSRLSARAIRMLVYEAICETLKRLGARNIFGLMGDGNMRYIAQWKVFPNSGSMAHGTRNAAVGGWPTASRERPIR